MIQFRQKVFVAPLIAGAGKLLGSNALMGATMVGGMVQSSGQAKKQEAQNQEMMEQQARLQKATSKSLEKVAKAAQKDSSKAAQAAQVMSQTLYSESQKFFAAANPNFIKRVGNVTYDFARALNKNGAARKKVAQGLALGATMTAVGGIADKAIQMDRKKITGGAPLPGPQENPEEKRKKKRNALIKAGVTAAAAGTAIVAARKGALGKGWQNVSKRKWGGQNGWNSTLKSGSKEFYESAKSNLVPGKGEGAMGWIGPGLTIAFPAISAAGYVLGERKQLKDQATAQEKKYSENYQYQEEAKKKKSSILKAAGAGALAIGAIAAGRRGAFGAKAGRYLNDWYMSRGAQLSRIGNKVASGTKSGMKSSGKYISDIGNKMVDSGSVLWDKFNKKAVEGEVNKLTRKVQNAKSGKRSILQSGLDLFRNKESVLKNRQNIIKTGNARLAELGNQKGITGKGRAQDILSGKHHTSFIKSGLNSKVGRFITFQDGNTQEFLNSMAKNKSVGKDTRKVANFLMTGTGQTVAAVGAAGLGLAAMKPFEWGDKAVRVASKAVDKNAFAYEKSKEQEQ